MTTRKQPAWHKDRRRGFLVGLDYVAIYRTMNRADVPRGTARELAKRYRTTPGHILAIAGARVGRQYLGDLVQPLTAGLRAFKPENRSGALRTRGVIKQTLVYTRLRPKKQEARHESHSEARKEAVGATR